MAEALYRKYRPQIFEDVVGQEHIERTIKNAIEQDKVSHAYLFCGPRGTGKTTTARLVAKALLCQKGPTAEPDGTCEDCQLIAAGTHPDVYELDAASRTGVENVREEIIGRVQFAPTRGRYKIYIIDEVHMLSTAAFNALLKTLEEPPSHVVFILATTDPQKVPETILSRCQRFDFRRISNEAIVSRLGAVCMSEGVEFEGEALDVIAHKAEGGMRNALTSLEQLIAFGEGKVTLAVAERMLGGAEASDLTDIMRALASRDVAACFNWVAEYTETGADILQFARDLAQHIRNLYVMSLAGSDVALDVSAPERRALEAELPQFGSDRLARMLSVLGDVIAELKTSTNPRLALEIALTRMVRPEGDLTLEALAERVEQLERNGSVVLPNSGTADAAVARSAQSSRASEGSRAAVRVASETPRISSTTSNLADVGGPASFVQTPVAPAFAPTAPVAPAPASAPAPTTAVRSGYENPAALGRMWQQALSLLKKDKAAYGVLFLNTKAIYNAATDSLSIQFPQANTFAFNAVQKQDVRDAVAAALQQASGKSFAFTYTQAGTASAAGTSVANAPAAPASAVRSPVANVVPVANPAPRPVSKPVAAPQSVRPTTQPSAKTHSSVPAARQVAVPPAAPPADDEVPLDVYDQVPQAFDEPDFAATSAQAPAAASAPTPTPTPASATSTAAANASVSQAATSADDLQAMLSAGFGENIVVEEIDQ